MRNLFHNHKTKYIIAGIVVLVIAALLFAGYQLGVNQQNPAPV